MSLVTSVLLKLGLMRILPRVDQFAWGLALARRARTLSVNKPWHSQGLAREFENSNCAHRAINESYSRLPVAR